MEGDITINLEWVEYHVRKCDVILPLVAIATPATYVREPLRVFELDFEANLPIIRHCVKYKKRVVFPSTSEVYGASRDKEFDPETSELVLGPIHKQRWIYSCVKQLLDRIIWAYGQQGLQFTLFRPFNWIGSGLDSMDDPKEGSSRVLTQFLGHIVRGEPIKLVDGGTQTRAFTFIDDAVECLTTIIDNPNGIADGKIYNIGNPHNLYSIRKLAEMMLEIALSRPEYAPTARQHQADRGHLRAQLLRQGLCGYSGAPALDQEHHGGTQLDAEDRHARGIQGDLRFLRARVALRFGTVVPRCLISTHIGLKVDVDTLRGTREGVPRLTALFKKLGIDATFYFSVGPDNTGRAMRRVFRKGFAKKVARTSVLKHYGMKTLLYGVLLPGPDIGLKAGAIDAQRARQGFEVGLHTYDHVRWQDNVASASAAWTRIEFERGMNAFERVFGYYPKSHAAAGWQINAHALELEREYGLSFASDTRGQTPFWPMLPARRSSCPQLPTTLPTFDELLGQRRHR